MKTTFGKLLEYLDGAGLILTDDGLIEEALEQFGFDLDSIVEITIVTEEDNS